MEDERLEAWISQEDITVAERVLRYHGLKKSGFIVGFGPGANHPKRVWPIENFVQLGKWLTKKHACRIVVVGGKNDRVLGETLKLSVGERIINVVGQTSIRQTQALLRRCVLFVGNDAGPMHLAASVGAYVLEISCHSNSFSSVHPNSPERFSPWGVRHRVLRPTNTDTKCKDACLAAEAHCIKGVKLEEVKKAVSELLSRHY